MQIDFRTVPINVPSLCIPRVYPNISEARIRKIFDELALGSIDHLDIISKTTEKGEKFNRVFIHFRRWYTDGNAGVARERLLNGKDIKIIYDDPWFWKVSAYREQQASAARPEPRQHQNHAQKKPTILFEDEDDNKKQRNHYEDQRPRPGSSYDDDRRIKHTPHRQENVHRQENFQNARPKPESGGFKKVTKADIQDTQGPTRHPTIAPPTIAPPTIAPALKVEEEDKMLEQKVQPKKKTKATAKKPLLKVEETQQEQNNLEDGEIATNGIEK